MNDLLSPKPEREEIQDVLGSVRSSGNNRLYHVRTAPLDLSGALESPGPGSQCFFFKACSTSLYFPQSLLLCLVLGAGLFF